MTYHSSFDWKFGDPISEELVIEVASGLEDTRDYCEGEGQNGYMKCAYMVMSNVDDVIFNIGNFLDCHESFTSHEVIKYFDDSNPPPYVVDLIVKVLEKMGKLEVENVSNE